MLADIGRVKMDKENESSYVKRNGPCPVCGKECIWKDYDNSKVKAFSCEECSNYGATLMGAGGSGGSGKDYKHD